MHRDGSGTGRAAAAAAAELRSAEGAVAAPPLRAAAPSVSPGWAGASPGETALGGGGASVREQEGHRAGRGRKTQWRANLSPNQEHEHSHLINSHS